MHAAHILIPYRGARGAKAKALKKKKALKFATSLREQVAGGAEFARLATEHSSCPSRHKGGDLGEFGRGQMAPTFEQAAFSLEIGGLSEVVETEFGFHLVIRTA